MQMYKYRQQAAVRAPLLCQTWQIKKSYSYFDYYQAT